MKRYLIIGLLSGVCTWAHAREAYVITLDATINVATEDYIHKSIQKAASNDAECLVIRLNTPGGDLKSTRSIVSDLLSAPLPVIVYVWPSGAQSASAGTFITLAAHIAAMAPGTNIGAAHPVGAQGQTLDSTMNSKATNDAAAFIRTISEKRNRNVKWAEDAVRRSVSITETEALHEHVIDVIAPNVRALLDSIDGKTVTCADSARTLHTRDAEIVTQEMGWRDNILQLLNDPTIAYILFMLGVYGLMFELYNPGSVVPGVVGAICIILAFYSFHSLPVNYAGLALIIVGVILFVLELKITSYGLLSIGGIVSIFLGSVMLIDSDSSLAFVSISLWVIIPIVLFTALFFLFAIGMGVRAQRRKPTTGIEGLVGEEGVAATALSPDGKVRVHGELWNATSADSNLKKGTAVRVVQARELRLTVKRIS